jgi:hypothetical protein
MNMLSIVDRELRDDSRARCDNGRGSGIHHDRPGDRFNPRISGHGEEAERDYECAEEQVADELPGERNGKTDVAVEAVSPARDGFCTKQRN